MSTSNEPVAPVDPAAVESEARSTRLGTVARNLTLVNLSITAAALISSPLQARALGPAGRGDLAAVTIVLNLFGLLGDVGLGAYVVWASARGVALRRLAGSVGPMLLGLGLLYAAAGPFLSRLIAGDRETVRDLLLASFLLMPLIIPLMMTTAVVWGHQRWRLFTLLRLTLPVGTLIMFSVLYALDALTVASASITVMSLAIGGALPGLVMLRGAGRPQWDRATAVEAGGYGRRVWLTTLANQTNARFDQLLMTRLVSSSELGLYVVAVNVSLLQNVCTNALASALLPRVAAGDPGVAARAIRMMIVLTLFICSVLFVAVPLVIPTVFGSSFSDSVLMCQILLVAAIPFGIVQLTTATLNGIGEPGVAARGELLSIAITVPSLVVFVRRYGGEAAAFASLAAYSATSVYLLRAVRSRLGVGWSELLVLRRGDLQVLPSLSVIGRYFKR